jgi:hypothetical protein
MNTRKNLIVGGVILLGVMGIWFVISRNDNRVDVPTTVNQGGRTNKEILPVTWKEYQSEELGISFSYPDEYLKKPIGILLPNPVTTGELFQAQFTFPSGTSLSITSITPDYTAPKDGNWGTGLGYEEQNGKYFLKRTQGKKYEVYPTKFLYVGNQKVLTLQASDFPEKAREEYYAPDVLAIINLPNERFPGLGFELNQRSATSTSLQDEKQAMERILTSIVFTKK